MTHEPQETISSLALRPAAQVLLGKRQRLAWAVELAQESLEQLSPGRLYDRRLELTAFLAWGGGRLFVGPYYYYDVALCTKEEVKDAQEEFIRILTGIVSGEEIAVGEYTLRLTLRRAGNCRVSLREGLDLNEVKVREQAAYGLARVLAEIDHDMSDAGDAGPMVRVCPAPKPRARGGEVCGRWFVGRPNQVYCSSQCQNRAATRATRSRASTTAPGAAQGTRKPRRQRRG
jgi:hypothetical protein